MRVLAKQILASKDFAAVADGAPPLVLHNSKGRNLSMLKIYGASGGVGDPDGSGGYSIKIVSRGKNLFDASGVTRLANRIPTASKLSGATGGYSCVFPCRPNTTYTVSRGYIGMRFRLAWYKEMPTMSNQPASYGYTENDNGSTITVTTGDGAVGICIYYMASNDTVCTEEQMRSSIQIEQGSAATPFEKYHAPRVVREPLYTPLENGMFALVGSVVPTVKGTAVIEIETAAAPPRVVANYRASVRSE